MADEEVESKALAWTESGCRQIANAVAKSNQAQPPICDDVRGYRVVANQLQKRVTRILKRIWHSPLDTLAHLDSANDILLERLEITLSQLAGTPAAVIHKRQPCRSVNDGAEASSKRSCRPQLLFKDPIDNSNAPWMPPLSVKHNAIEEYALRPFVDENDRIVNYEHPYAAELRLYRPPNAFLHPNQLKPIGLKDNSETPLQYVETKTQLIALIEHLKNVTEIAVDIEHHSYRSFQGFVCLIQISTETGGDFIVDALALREHLHLLNDPFTNPNILKVFHGADCDIVWLQRDFGVYVVGMFDTHRAAIELRFQSKSLQSILWKYCKVRTDKSLRLADWRIRPLEPALIEYARTDTHNLLYIWRRMRTDLFESKGGDLQPILNVFEESKTVCLLTYKKPVCDDNYINKFTEKSKTSFDSQQNFALKRLLVWRDEVAREEDESYAYVIPNHMILKLVQEMPKEMAGILVCCYPTPPLLLHNLNVVLQIFNMARMEPITDVVLKPIIEEITETPKSIHIYNNQSLQNYSAAPDLLNCIKSLKNLNMKPKNVCLLQNYKINRMESGETKDFIHFVSPFHRRILVQKYSEAIHCKSDNVDNENINSTVNANNADLENIVTNIKSEDEDEDDNENSPSSIKETQNNTDISKSTTHKANKRHSDSIIIKEETNEIPTKKPKNNESEENSFTAFDYKSYDYNTFNKDSYSKKTKKKHKFNSKKA